MDPILAFLLQAVDTTTNNIILGVLIALAVVLGMSVLRKRQKA
jgi:LPXTG-motif cell wall-anchored protein